MKDFLYKKIIYYFLLLGPLLDILTSFMIKSEYTLTIGIIVRLFVLLLMIIYLILYDKANIKNNLIYLSIILIFSILNVLNNKDILNNYFFNYSSYLFKYLYFLISILFYIRWYKYSGLTINKFNIPIVIIIVSSFIGIITNTSYLSYAIYSHKEGISGFFSSSNEFGNLLCLLLPISIYNAFHNHNSSRISIIYPILLGIIMLLLGTKVGLFGYFIILILYLIIRLILRKNIIDRKSLILILLMIIIPICFYNKLPAIRNIKFHQINNSIEEILLNGRDKKFKIIKNNYKNSNIGDKLFGKYYIDSNKNEIIVIEQDFYDIFFMNGIFGLILIIGVYIYLGKVFLKNKRNNFWILLVIILQTSISFISGHSILSPSPSTYLCLLIVLYNSNLQNEICIKDKKRVMFVSSIGGHLTQLLKLKGIFNDYNYILITEKCDVTKPLKNIYNIRYLVNGSRKYLFKYIFIFIYNSFKSIYFFIKYHPDVIVTTGVHTSVVLCYLGYFFRKKIIFIESFSMQNTKTLSGTLVYPIATTFVVQWKSMLKVYPKAKYFGGMY